MLRTVALWLKIGACALNLLYVIALEGVRTNALSFLYLFFFQFSFYFVKPVYKI